MLILKIGPRCSLEEGGLVSSGVASDTFSLLSVPSGYLDLEPRAEVM